MNNYKEVLIQKGYQNDEITVNEKSMHVTIGGVKTEVQLNSRTLKPRRLKIGYGNSESDIQKLYELAQLEFGEDSVKLDSKIGLIDITKPTQENWISLIELMEGIEFDMEKPAGTSKPVRVGVNFVGTIFENSKERGATIGGKFGKLVCDASGMNRDEMLPEFYTEAGEIDGVEIDPETEDILSIYECQSGIHKGQYLDEVHLNKVMLKYLYDPKIIKTVRKIVILAGGYSEEYLNIIRERSKELLNRTNPIEIILLATTKEENKIGVNRVDFNS